MHPSNKLPALSGFEGEQTSSVRFIHAVMAILRFEWITTVIKYINCNKKSIVEHRSRQESFQKSSFGKISVSFRGEEKGKYCLFFRGAFVLSASELMKCSSDYVVHNHL